MLYTVNAVNLQVWQLSVANFNFESLLLSKLHTQQFFICLCMNQQLRKTLLCQHGGQALCIYHCLMSIIVQQINSLSWQHNYIFTFLVAVLAVQVRARVCVFVYVFCLTALHSYQQMLPKPPALSRLMNQRQVPEGKHVHCHMSLSWMAAFSMRHMP